MGNDTPKAPNQAKSYQAGIDVYLKNLPALLAAENSARATNDPQRIADQQKLQDQFGPNQYQQQLDALHQLDPASAVIRDQLAGSVSSDLASGYALPEGLKTQIENQIRGRQVLTGGGGSVGGNAPISAEAAYGATAAQNLYQTHLDNAGSFLGLPTPEQQILAVQPVSADRTSSYVDPNAGFQGQQFALNNYQNLLAQTQASGGSSAWTRALSGAATGAAAGSAAGGWGALIGAGAGAIGGGLGWG